MYRIAGDCTYTLCVGWSWISGRHVSFWHCCRDFGPLSVDCGHCLYWEHDIRPSASYNEISCWFVLTLVILIIVFEFAINLMMMLIGWICFINLPQMTPLSLSSMAMIHPKCILSMILRSVQTLY
jgi:hypothetical protein